MTGLLEEGDGWTVEKVDLGYIRESERFNPWLRQGGDAAVSLRRAQLALGKAQSWRDFRVSACAITLVDQDFSVSYIHGVNKKTKKRWSD